MILFFVARYPRECGNPMCDPAGLAASPEEAVFACKKYGPDYGYIPVEAPNQGGDELATFEWPRCECCGGLKTFFPSSGEYVGKHQRGPAATKIYLVTRVPCAHHGRLLEPMGVTLSESEAIAMCSHPTDAVIELDAGRLYPPGEEEPEGIRTLMPHCPQHSGWVLSKGLTVSGVKSSCDRT